MQNFIAYDDAFKKFFLTFPIFYIQHLSSLIDSASSSTHSIDDEVLRDHVITSLKLWVFEGTECIDTINQEIQLVSMRPPPGAYPPPVAEAMPRPHPPPKPVVITREMLKVNFSNFLAKF